MSSSNQSRSSSTWNQITDGLSSVGHEVIKPLPSVLTGYIAETARLTGHPILGRFLHLWGSEGLGKDITAAHAKAVAHSSGICTFFPTPVHAAAYITKPEHIAEYYYKKEEKEKNAEAQKPKSKKELRGDAGNIFQYIFDVSILSLASSDPRWVDERRFYVNAMMDRNRLRYQTPQMVKIVDGHLPAQNEITTLNLIELRQYINRTIIDLVAQTQIGFKDLTDDDRENLIDVVSRTMPEIAQMKTIATIAVKNAFGCAPKMPLDKIIENGKVVLSELIHRNKAYILAKTKGMEEDSVLRLFINEKSKDDIVEGESEEERFARFIENNEERLIRFVALILFAGFETTSTCCFFTLLLLSDLRHRDILIKLRENILMHWDGKSELTDAQIESMNLLDQVLRASLELYTPFPTYKDELSEDLTLRDEQAKKDVHLKKGTMLFLSPFRTHRLIKERKGEDPEKFDPREGLNELDTSCTFFSFGFGKRVCPGRKLAFREVKIMLIKMVMSHDLKLENLPYPYPVVEKFSLGLDDKVVDLKKAVVTISPLPKLENQVEEKEFALPGMRVG